MERSAASNTILDGIWYSFLLVQREELKDLGSFKQQIERFQEKSDIRNNTQPGRLVLPELQVFCPIPSNYFISGHTQVPSCGSMCILLD